MCSLIDILQWKKNQKDSDDFWHRKLTLKVKFWYFLTAPHYSNFQNLVISFEYSWFLAKNLSNFVSLPWKLHNRKCHNEHCATNFWIRGPESASIERFLPKNQHTQRKWLNFEIWCSGELSKIGYHFWK